MRKSTAAEIWPHLPHDDERVAKQSKHSVADSLWPQLSREVKAKDAATAKWQAEQKAQNKRIAEHLRQIVERIEARERKGK
jgi:hypothetical protein